MSVRFFKSTIISMAIFLVFSHSMIATSQETTEQNKKKKQISTEKAPPIPNVPVDSGNFNTEERSREEVKYVNGKREGKTIIWLNDGGRIDGGYIKGLKNGIWIHYNKVGKKIWQESYRKGIRDGIWIWYGANERKSRQESYKNGRLHGKSLSWAANGAKTADVDFQNGAMHGRQQLWFNGRLFHDWHYIQGKLDGYCVSWYLNGQKHFEGNFVMGTGKLKGWYESGKLFLESDFRDGKPIGQELCWYENGSNRKETHYDENGIQHGSYRFWDERGRLQVEKQFDHGTLLSHKEWDENGTLTYSYSKQEEEDKKKTIILNESVPSSYDPFYDLRQQNQVTAVKDQGAYPTCWAFAWMGAVEHNVMPATPEPCYSTLHLADKNHGYGKDGLTGGGAGEAIAYLTRGGGPINETTMPYPLTPGIVPLNRQISFPSVKWVRDILVHRNLLYSQGGDDFTKNCIFTLQSGGVIAESYIQQNLISTSSTYYCGSTVDGSNNPFVRNHGLIIIGWDDTYEKERFTPYNGHFPPENGAVFVKNSWGGTYPYLTISICDMMLLAKYAITEVQDPEYGCIYQYDPLGETYSRGFSRTEAPQGVWAANVFEARNPAGTEDVLRSVGFFLTKDRVDQCFFNYSIEVYTDLTDPTNPRSARSGHPASIIYGTGDSSSYPWYSVGGYFTRDLTTEVKILGGTKFSVMVKYTRDPNPIYPEVGFPIETRRRWYNPPPNDTEETNNSMNASSWEGESFYSLDGTNWIDLATSSIPGNACIKAFTNGSFDQNWRLKDALDDAALTVISDNGYNLNWKRVTDSSAPGNSNGDSVKSSWINTGERCHMKAAVTGPALVSFFWKVSSDPGNTLKLYIDQDPKKPLSEWVVSRSISGSVDWQQEQIRLENPGTHTLEWSYEKTVDATTSYTDRAWVDRFFKTNNFAVISPNGGEGWPQGANQFISWISGDITGNVIIELLKDDIILGSVAEVPAAQGIYSWSVGSWSGGQAPAGTGYKIRVRTPDSSVSDDSDGSFTILAQMANVISPNGGEILSGGGDCDVKWSMIGSVGFVNIDYSIDAGLNWISLAANTANDGVQSWTVPMLSSASCLVRVSDSSNSTLSDTSDALFAINALESISLPTQPVGLAFGIKDTSYQFSTGGALSNLGHPLQYCFDWGDGSDSGWLDEGITSATHVWINSGSYNVRARARCFEHNSVLSSWSSSLNIVITDTLMTPDSMWNTFQGGSNNEFGHDITMDGSGNIYVTGIAYGTWGSPLHPYGGGLEEAFVAKFDSNGTLRWHTFYGANNQIYGNSIVVDECGNIYFAGTGSNGSNGWDGFLAKLDATGTFQWIKYLGGVGAERVYSIVLESDGSIIAMGDSSATWGNPRNPHNGGISDDIFLARIDANGLLQWNTFMGCSGYDTGRAITVGNDSMIYVTGESGGSWGNPVNPYPDEICVFWAKYNAFGDVLQNTFVPNMRFITLYRNAIAVDKHNACYLAGESMYGWGNPVNPFGGGIYDTCVVKISPSGEMAWHTFIGGTGDDAGLGISVDNNDSIIVAGHSPDPWGIPLHSYSGGKDCYVAKLNPQGERAWHTFIGGNGNDIARSSVLDRNDNIVLLGSALYNWGSPINPYAAMNDIFVAKLAYSNSSLTVLSPNGGENFIGGETRTIAWTPIDWIDEVNIEYSSNGGCSWNAVAIGIADIGSYSWTVPTITSNKCLVRVCCSANGNPSDISDSVFAINSMSLISPNGGEHWIVSESHNITWNSAGTSAAVNIDYSINNGSNWISLAAGTLNDGIFIWTIPSTPSTSCLVRVSEVGDADLIDQSDAVFTIAEPAETVLAPTTPTGPSSGSVGSSYDFSTSGSTSSLGHDIQYKFDWDDGSDSGWLAVGTTTASHAWAASGIFQVKAMARCAVHTGIVSVWSEALEIDISCDSPCSQYCLLHEFAGGDDDGLFPWGDLTISGSTLYGMTQYGGSNDKGTIFKIENNGSGFALLHEFAGSAIDGQHPMGSLIMDGTTMYGMTHGGMVDDFGTIFKIQSDGTGFAVLHAFAGASAEYPQGSLILDGSTLYGMAGSILGGIIFKIQTDGSDFTILHGFSALTGDGYEPKGSLTISGSTLFGMTYDGGGSGHGTIFKIQTDGSGYALLHEFSGGITDGGDPYGSLLLIGSELFGMTQFGMNSGGTERVLGTVFKISTAGSEFSLLHAFPSPFVAAEGMQPHGSLVFDGSTLFGMTHGDGETSYGTVFRMKPDGSDFTSLHIFLGGVEDGRYPEGSLLFSGGILYGMTKKGGNDDGGVIFCLPILSSLNVTSPNGGESWSVGTSQEITWSTTGTVGNVAIDYSIDNGTNWISIADNTDNDGSYSWMVPNTPSTTCLVRVSDTDGDPHDTSDSVFTITSSGAETVSAPTTPTGPSSGSVGSSYDFVTGGSTSSLGHDIQYLFDWDDGSDSGWLAVGTTTASHAWAAAGTYYVRAMARCATHTTIESAWSESHAVSISGGTTSSYYNSPAAQLVLPEVNWAAAYAGGTWISEVQIVDVSGGSTVQAYYNSGTTRRGPFTLWDNSSGGAGSSTSFANILSTLSGLDGGFTYLGTSGALELLTQDNGHLLQASSRTYNGNYSRTFPALADVEANTAASGRSLGISNITYNGSYRPSVVLFNPSADSVTVLLTVLGANGSPVLTVTRTLAGREMNTVVDELRVGSYANATVLAEVTSGAGRVFASGQTANATTNDPAAHMAVQVTGSYANSSADYLVLPEVNWADAWAGGTWISEVQIVDVTGGSVVQAYYNSGTTRRGPFTLWDNSAGGAGSSTSFVNILSTLSALDGGFTYLGTSGALELASQDNGHLLQASSRTYNGDYSRTFPALADCEANTAASARSLVVSNVTYNGTYRPSVVLFNPSVNDATVKVTVLGADGSPVLSVNKTVAGREMVTIVDDIRVGSYADATVRVEVTAGAGRVFASGQTANAATNDPAVHIAVQAQ